MSEENKDQKTQDPTPRRKEKARRDGDIARSKDLTLWATLVGGFVGAGSFGETSVGILISYMQHRLGALNGAVDLPAMMEAFWTLLQAAAPTAAGAATGWAIAVAAQLGWPPALSKPKFNITKIITFSGAKQIFAPKEAAIRLGMAGAKVILVLGAACAAIYKDVDLIGSIPALAPGALATRLVPVVQHALQYGAGALALLAAVDFWHQRRTHAQRLKMTPEEVKREMKENEGDPQFKNKRRQRARDLAKKPRPEFVVPTADVVIVNPTHYSVALRYDKNKENAPRVVAKGVDGAAAKIREVARKSGVPIVERPPLARMMHKLVDEGETIPEDLYNAVAEVLAYVYKLRGRVG
ncbi:MAG: flagellar biosynthesis protein FlhB [Nannocystaceae bacterium]|nr:EscU/YscU/HrcU family type III secretion system export apparatus switch protein [bacterium]